MFALIPFLNRKEVRSAGIPKGNSGFLLYTILVFDKLPLKQGAASDCQRSLLAVRRSRLPHPSGARNDT